MIDFLANAWSYGQTAIVFLMVLSFLVFIHEWGHFIAAKKSGVKVEEFAIGLGAKIWSKQVGETLYRLNWLPFGGYVKMLGEEENAEDPRAFNKASLLKRMWITLNGIIVNLIFTILAFTLLFSIGKMVSVEVDGADFKPVPQTQSMSVGQSFLEAIDQTWIISKLSIQKLAELPQDIINKGKIPDSVSGPVGIAQVTHYVIPNGFWAILRFAAVISLSLGVMNLLPIPALDGGRFLFQLVELILKPFGVKLSDKIEQWVHGVGFLLLIGLILIISGNDVLKIWQQSHAEKPTEITASEPITEQ